MSNPIPPEKLRLVIDETLANARKQLVERGEVSPIALIVGDDETGVVDMLTKNNREKDQVALAIRGLVDVHQAHTVLFVSECWTLPHHISVEEGRALYAKYGAVSKMPQAIEAVVVSIETRDGQRWRAMSTILRKGRAVKLADPCFTDDSVHEPSGRFSGFFAPERPSPLAPNA